MRAYEVAIELIGGVALMLWALRMVRTGMMRTFGSRLRAYLGAAMGSRLKSFAAGLVATVLLQSSTATGLLTGSFAGRGLIATAPALAVMLGADVGSALVAQVVSLGMRSLGPLLIAAGTLVFLTSFPGQRRDLGRCLVGAGLLLLALRLLVGATEGLRYSPQVPELFAMFGGLPLAAVAFAALLTWLAHSSLAMVVLCSSLAGSLVVDARTALYLVVGINIGGSLAPVMATLAAPASARRVPLGNLLFKLFGAAVVLPMIGLIPAKALVAALPPATLVAVAHLVFNVALAVVMLGLTEHVARLTTRLLPDVPEASGEDKPRFLDNAMLEVPPVALSLAARETLRMADTVQSMLVDTLRALSSDQRTTVAEVRRRDDVLDNLHDEIKLYLSRLAAGEQLGADESRRWLEIMEFSTSLEHVGDIIEKSLMDVCEARIKKGETLSKQTLSDFSELHAEILENLKLAMTVFVSRDPEEARQLVERKRALRDRERRLISTHFERLRLGEADTILSSAFHVDVLRDLRLINSHLTSTGYSILAMAEAPQASAAASRS